MSLAMDKALMALSLEEEEEAPFVMPELPGFSSAEENKLSLIGRLLNPQCQKMSSLIMKMPRVWQKEGRVRGIALSQERFQFIFQNEFDLLDVLERGVHTFNEWVIVVERWVENPPEDYLQFIPIWVQISNIPVNCYTTGALTALGDLVGKTVVVAFDPTKPVTQDFIRVQVKFNVANPLKRSRVISLKGGVSATILFHYEKIQKRCFTCQRLNHEKDFCPIEIRQRQEASRVRREEALEKLKKKELIIPEDDVLFGVLEESQVGIDSATGRCKIAKDVLDEMRKYLLADTGDCQAVKIDRIKQSVKSAEKDPISQRAVLRLEAPPLITADLNKGKGMVFDYSDQSGESKLLSIRSNPEKLLAASFTAHAASTVRSAPFQKTASQEVESSASVTPILNDYPTVFKAGCFAHGSSGIVKKRPGARRRPPKTVRDQSNRERLGGALSREEVKRDGKQCVGSKKRKCDGEESGPSPTNKAVCLKAIPSEGLPKPQ